MTKPIPTPGPRKTSRRYLAVLALLVLYCAPHTAASDMQEWLDAYTQDLRERQNLIGVSTAVTLPDGRTLVAAAGLADKEDGSILTPMHRMPGGSTGKTYVAATVMRLAEQGYLDTNDLIGKYLAGYDWFESLPNGGEITIANLLNHSAGVPDYVDDWDFMAAFLMQRLTDADSVFTHEEMLGFVLGETPTQSTGAAHRYSDLNYFVLGFVIEAVTGKPYYQVLREEILDPLGLHETLPATRRDLPGLATGYAYDSWLNRLTGLAGASIVDGKLSMDPSIEWTGGGLIQTPAALSRFYHALGDGTLLSQESMTRMRSESLPVAPDSTTRYGLGMFISEREELGTYISHSGYYPGYLSNVAYFDRGDFSVAIQTNRDHEADIYTPLREIAAAVQESLPADTVTETLTHSIWQADTQIGTQTLSYFGDDRITLTSRYRTQGKEPRITVDLIRDQGKIPRRMYRQGLAYLYHPIDESFLQRGDGFALWRNRVERVGQQGTGSRYYVPIDLLTSGDTAPAEKALLAEAALARPEGRVDLLPRGQAQATVVTESALGEGDHARTLRLVELAGLTLTPAYFWIDDRDRFFAEIGNAARLASAYPPGSDAMRGLVARMAASATALDPSLTVYEEFLANESGTIKPAYATYEDRLPLQTLRGAKTGPLRPPDDLSSLDLAQLFEDGLTLVSDAWRAGVTIIPGTDHRTLPGLAYVRELELLVAAGIPPAEVLQIATYRAATLIGKAGTLGSVDIGKVADLVLVSGNPVQNISDARNVTHVWRAGRGYPVAALYEAIGLVAD